MIVEEKTISSDRIYTGKVISLKVDTVEIERKGYQKREIIEHPGAVGIVALTEDNKVVLVKQFRKGSPSGRAGAARRLRGEFLP